MQIQFWTNRINNSLYSICELRNYLIFPIDNNQVPQAKTAKKFKYPRHWRILQNKKRNRNQVAATEDSKIERASGH